MNLLSVAEEIQHRIIHIFGRDNEGKRATNGGVSKLDQDPHFRDYLQFFEVSRKYSCLLYLLTKYISSSSSMRTAGVVSVLLTKLVGLGLLPSISCRAELPAVYLKHLKVSLAFSDPIISFL